MRIITYFFLVLILALSSAGWQKFQAARTLEGRAKKDEQEVILLKGKYKSLSRYKEEPAGPLAGFYPEVFNNLREACLYYGAPCEIKIPGAKDFVDTQDFFKDSEYKGVKSVDALCQIKLTGISDADLSGIIYKIIKFNPVEILEVKLEKDTLSLTMRLYGL